MRFDANVNAGLPWRFVPERNTIDVRLGEVVTVDHAVTNEIRPRDRRRGRLQRQSA